MTSSMTATFSADLFQPALQYMQIHGVPIRVVETPVDYVNPSIQIATTIFAAAVSVVVIVIQLRRQHQEAIKQHKRSVKADLQLEAYRDFQSAIRPYSDSSTPASTIASIRTAFAIAVARTRAGQAQSPVIYRTPAFMAELNRHTDAAVRLTFFLERYEALLIGFDIFKIAIGSAISDVHTANLPFQSLLAHWLPIENPNVECNPAAPQFIHRPDITQAALDDFDAAATPLSVALGRLQCWITDLSVEVQNHLLGEYADQLAKRRNAPDQAYFTVTAAVEDRARLDALFGAMPYMQRSIAAEHHARQANQVA